MAAKSSSIKFPINAVYQSVYISLALDERYKSEKHPVVVRVTKQRKRLYYPTGLKLTEADFEKMLRTNKGTFYEMRLEQQKIFDKVVTVTKNLVDEGVFTIDNLKTALYGEESTSFTAAFDERIVQLRSNGQISSANIYRYTVKKIERVLWW